MTSQGSSGQYEVVTPAEAAAEQQKLEQELQPELNADQQIEQQTLQQIEAEQNIPAEQQALQQQEVAESHQDAIEAPIIAQELDPQLQAQMQQIENSYGQ